ncbi:hypothetical protein QJS10_CPB13g01059 [Acorus calamus]|uniref:Uncharacterized protein n=1 Tax=Acorus calamus TaxID=4465 RepID=A0AAV9DJ83_ACOCL|nr:hypothetical protein QJS10_CPB13g01059 [Acorus calamus]
MNKISKLQVDGWIIENDQDIKEALVNHFKGAFNQDRRWRIPDGCLQRLEGSFTEEEVKAAVFWVYADKAPGPDGFGVLFIQDFWDVARDDVLEMFEEFFHSLIEIGSLNSTFLTSSPSVREHLRLGSSDPFASLMGVSRSLQKSWPTVLRKS